MTQAALGFIGRNRPDSVATLEIDATLIGTRKRAALPCYEGFKAYRPPMLVVMVAANDLVFRRGTDSPTVRIDGLTMAGA